GSGKDDTKTAEIDEEKKAQCDAIAAKVPASCDLKNPPVFVANGCGRVGDPIPDHLMIEGLVLSDFGQIFTGACNKHDECYSTYGTDKEACDLSLYTNMMNDAERHMTKFQWTYFRSNVAVQALGFSS